MMAQQTTAATLATSGVATTATVAAVRPTGMQINLAPVVDIDLTVFRNGVPGADDAPGGGAARVPGSPATRRQPAGEVRSVEPIVTVDRLGHARLTA